VRCLGDGQGSEIVMRAGGKDAVQPGLLVLVSGGSECRAAEFLSVKSKGRLLRRVAEGVQCS